MYFSFYGLKEKPFQISTDPRFLWLGEKHKEALSALRYGILDNKGFLLLTGDVGTGKTTLINALLNIIGGEATVATVPDPSLDKLDFYNFIAHAFKLGREFNSKGTFLVYFSDFLHETYNKGRKILLIVDEAQKIQQEMLEEIRLLSNFERQDTKLLNIFFVGQIEFNNILLQPENRAIRQRITINYNIEPLTEQETEKYIQHRLKIAGCAKKLFNAGALKAIYAFSKGYPRLINIICDRSLLTGYVEEAKTINAKIVEECADELRIPNYTLPLAPNHLSDGAKQIPGKHGGKEYRPVTTNASNTIVFLLLFLILLFLAGGSWYYYDLQQRPLGQVNGAAQQRAEQTVKPAAPAPLNLNTETEIQKAESKKNSIATAEDVEKNNIPAFQPPIIPQTEEAGIVERPAFDAEKSIVSPLEPVNITPPIEKEPNDILFPSVAISDLKLVVNFGHDSILPSDESLLQLSQFANRIQEEAPSARIIVRGYTDSSGPEQYNEKLSEFRANIVKGFLVGRGINNSQIITIGLGSKNPAESNRTLQGRIINRRVEIEVAP